MTNKKLYYTIFIALFLGIYSSSAQQVKIIFDTDMESDVDDVGALALLHGLAANGEAEILATMVCSLNPWAVPTVDAINTYFNQPNIPIGAVKTYGVYRNSKYAKIISEEFPQDIGLGENAPDAVTLYRQILSSQSDTSVVIVTVGYLSNLSNLLSSPPDNISPLNGVELVKQKVKHLVCMGGRYPYSQDIGRWGNFKPDPDAIVKVSKFWPTLITFTGGGDFADLIKTGSPSFNHKSKTDLVARAYNIFLEGWNRDWHHSADLIAVYAAVRGYNEFFKLHTQGYNHIFEDGTLMWRLQPNDPRHQLINEFKEGVSASAVTNEFDRLMNLANKEMK